MFNPDATFGRHRTLGCLGLPHTSFYRWAKTPLSLLVSWPQGNSYPGNLAGGSCSSSSQPAFHKSLGLKDSSDYEALRQGFSPPGSRLEDALEFPFPTRCLSANHPKALFRSRLSGMLSLCPSKKEVVVFCGKINLMFGSPKLYKDSSPYTCFRDCADRYFRSEQCGVCCFRNWPMEVFSLGSMSQD